MASLTPFSPVTSSTTGATTKVTANNTPSSVSGSISAANSIGNTIVVTNAGTVLVFVRMSGEATPTATAADYPLLPGTQVALMNPNAGGTVGLAVLSSTTTSADVYFTPGEGQ